MKVYSTAHLARTALPLAEFQHVGNVTAMDFSSAGQLCVSHSDGATIWMDARDSESHEHSILDEGSNKRCVAFSGDGNHVAVSVGEFVCIICVESRTVSLARPHLSLIHI